MTRPLALLTILALALATPAQTQTRDDGTKRDDTRDRTSRTSDDGSARLRTDGITGPETETALRTITANRLLMRNSGQTRRVTGYVSGIPETEGWTCDADAGLCLCDGVEDCADLILSSDGISGEKVVILYTVQADDHSAGLN